MKVFNTWDKKGVFVRFYRTVLLWALVAGTCVSSLNASAAEDIFGRKINSIGCHNTNGTCFVDLDGAAFGASLNCPLGATNQFRFDNGDTTDGKRTFAALMAAYISGKHISVHLDGCSAQGWPTIQWFNVTD
jgi:hypothetical protein